MFARKRQQLEIARATLLFYACQDTYRRRCTHPKGARKRFAKAPIVVDHGSRAAQALRRMDDLQKPVRTYLARLAKPTRTTPNSGQE